MTVSVRLRGCCLEVQVDHRILRAYHLMNYSQSSDSRSCKMNNKVGYLDDLHCRLKEKVMIECYNNSNEETKLHLPRQIGRQDVSCG